MRLAANWMKPMKPTVRELTPERWPDLERLFGPRGACGGCWCMWWRLEKGEKWGDLRGARAKRRFKRLVLVGKAHGALAYLGKEPVGWVSFERRTDLPRLDRAPSLRCEDASEVWSIPCFFVRRDHQGKGVATALLQAARALLKRRGARLAEGYPVKLSPGGGLMPPLFAYTGTLPMFERAGFAVATARPRGKQRVRKRLA